MALVAKRLCAFHQVTWCNWVPGRLQQLRLFLSGRTLDILHCCQHVNRYGNIALRQQFWHTFPGALPSIPNRNLLLVAGGMNTSLTHANTYVGLATYLWNAERCNASSLHPFLTQFDLVALNSWNRKAGPTFCNNTGEWY